MAIVTKRVRLEKDVIGRVKRSLPGKGRFNVQVGQEVTADEIIGIAEQTSGFRIINVAKGLSILPAETEKYLQRKVGQKIYRGELLAYKKGNFILGKKVVVSPTDGIVDFINSTTGEVKISFLPKKVELPAATFGIVEVVDQSRGICLIKTQLTRIYGIFGTGRTRDGILRVLGSRGALINSQHINLKDSEHILVGGSLIYRGAISAAISNSVNGIITGGINAKDYQGMAGGRLIFPKRLENDIGISIVVCEGFGSAPIGDDIYGLLVQHDHRFAFVDGNQAVISLPSHSSDSLRQTRATQLPPATEQEVARTASPQFGEISLGAYARISGVTYLGEQGKIVKIDQSKTKMPSGVWGQLVTIETRTRKIQVPISNIELI